MIDLSVSLSNFLNNIFSIVSEFGLNGQKDGQSFYSSVNQCYSLINATLKRIPKEAVENILEKRSYKGCPYKPFKKNRRPLHGNLILCICGRSS